MTSCKVLENDNYNIVLLELVNCNSNDELKARERDCIQTLDCVNKNIPLRTRKEYRKDNKEAIAEYHKEYREDNKEAIAEYHKAFNKEYRKTNKEHIAEKRKVLFTCDCGSTISVCNKSAHCKSLKHLKYCEGSS
tara:strand:+ start:547 stop:951 length:405 start_codon:yes stop_codon:yes gene_type:complete